MIFNKDGSVNLSYVVNYLNTITINNKYLSNFMTEEMLDNWIEKLKSGNFNKGMNNLHNCEDNSYCCLGILAEMNGQLKDNIFVPIDVLSFSDTYLCHTDSNNKFSYYYLPRELQELLATINDGSETFNNVIVVLTKIIRQYVKSKG